MAIRFAANSGCNSYKSSTLLGDRLSELCNSTRLLLGDLILTNMEHSFLDSMCFLVEFHWLLFLPPLVLVRSKFKRPLALTERLINSLEVILCCGRGFEPHHLVLRIKPGLPRVEYAHQPCPGPHSSNSKASNRKSPGLVGITCVFYQTFANAPKPEEMQALQTHLMRPI